MKKKRISLLRGIAVCVNAAAAAVLAVGFVAGMRAGYGSETWKEILGGKNYVETAEFQEQAASSVYDALEAAVRDSRMEKDGQYDPQRIIRLRDYLDNGTIYDEMPEKEKGNGICYRLGDLYQWSLKGTSYLDDVLNESYKPLFYGSIQEYCNECDEEYKAVVDQLVKSMKQIQREVALYQEQQKNWSAQATNVRYLLWDLGNGNVYTNVDSLQSENSQDTFAAYFKSLGSYYIYDSRTISVAQQNVGDYYSYNTHDLLEGWNIHLAGEYLVYVGIDTTFPATDVLSAAAQKYQEAESAALYFAYGGSSCAACSNSYLDFGTAFTFLMEYGTGDSESCGYRKAGQHLLCQLSAPSDPALGAVWKRCLVRCHAGRS